MLIPLIVVLLLLFGGGGLLLRERRRLARSAYGLLGLVLIFPRLVRRGIHMHPLGVILAILSGAELAGMVGIFLAIPAVAVLSALHRHLLEYHGSGGLVSELFTPAQSARGLARRTSDSAETHSAYPAADTSALQPRSTVVTQ